MNTALVRAGGTREGYRIKLLFFRVSDKLGLFSVARSLSHSLLPLRLFSSTYGLDVRHLAVAKGKKGAAGAKKKTAAGTKPGTVKVVTIKKKIGKKGGKVVSTKVIKSPAGAGKKWKNDKFVADAAKPDSVGLKLFISNLDWGVTNKDLKELFGEYGALKSFNVHFNAQGKSQGTADVVFRNRSEALKAMKMYNGRTLDGRVMQIQALNDVNTAKPNDKKILSSGK